MFMFTRKQLTKDEHGQTIVETAIALAILLVMIIGLVEGGLLFYTYHYVSYAARQGSRYAMVRGSACDPSGGMPNCPATAAQAQGYVASLTFMGIDSTTVLNGTTVTWGTSPNETTCTAPCNNPGDQVTVTVTYPFTTGIPFIPAHLFNLSSTSQRVIAQ
jgi:Flp pilus assembly protein TadG